MTSRTKLVASLCAIASAFVLLGYATFEQWSAFVLHVVVSP